MLDYRVKYLVYWIFLTGMVFGSLVCCPSYAQAQETLPLDDPNAVMKIVISSLNSMEHPITGRGTATMKIENIGGDLGGKDLIVDFVFKDQKSRVDIFESDGAGGGIRVRTVAKSDKALFRVLPTEVHVDRVELYDHSIGQDFHPETFFRVLGEELLVEWLEVELGIPRAPGDRSVVLGNDGILHIMLHVHYTPSNRPEYDDNVKISLDTEKGFVPVFIGRKVTRANGSWSARQVKLQWSKFGSTWYVSDFEYNELPSNHRHTVGTIKNFMSNVKVSDDEFTLDGMGIPEGLEVVDRVAGLTYRHKAPFGQKAQEQQLDLATQTVDSNVQKRIGVQNQPALNNNDSIPSAIIGQNHDSLWMRVTAVTCVIALIGIVAFFGYKYMVTRADD